MPSGLFTKMRSLQRHAVCVLVIPSACLVPWLDGFVLSPPTAILPQTQLGCWANGGTNVWCINTPLSTLALLQGGPKFSESLTGLGEHEVGRPHSTGLGVFLV